MNEPTFTLALCIATFRRPEGLRRLLDGLEQMDPVDGVDTTVVVVDNDETGPAAWAGERTIFGNQVRYAVEERRGITFARNRALDEVKTLGTDWLGWLDDDEVPRPNWLRDIIETQRRTGADVVAGPAEPVFEPGAPAWIVDTGAFGTERFETDQPFPFFHTRTSGVILRSSLVPDGGFDNRMALTGGSDRVFFTHMHRAGGDFRWNDEAVVDEWVPASRVRASWLLRRWFRIGVTRSLTLLYVDSPSPLRRLRRAAGGTAMALGAMPGLLLAVPGGRTAILNASRRMLLGIGAAWGVTGIGYNEYQKVHGS
ncbi:MAG: glycosyltransferase [Actinomycetota bacterium]